MRPHANSLRTDPHFDRAPRVGRDHRALFRTISLCHRWGGTSGTATDDDPFGETPIQKPGGPAPSTAVMGRHDQIAVQSGIRQQCFHALFLEIAGKQQAVSGMFHEHHDAVGIVAARDA